MVAAQAFIIGDEFRRGFRLQTTWGWSMATAFFFGELGAGLFLVSLLLGLVQGQIIGLLLTAVGKTAGHIVHMGRPNGAWRAILRLDRSWVSRGLLAIIVFTGFGILHVLDAEKLTFGLLPQIVARFVEAAAAAAALVIMVYQGLAMSHSSAIGLWSTGLMPVASFIYALLGGVSLVIALAYGSLSADRPVALEWLELSEIVLMVCGLVMIAGLLRSATCNSNGGRLSVTLLLRSRLAPWFIGLVVVIGLILPGVLVPFALAGLVVAVATCAAVLIGFYAFRVLILKAAVYDPIQSFLSDLPSS